MLNPFSKEYTTIMTLKFFLSIQKAQNIIKTLSDFNFTLCIESI